MWFQNKSPDRNSVIKRAVGSLAPSLSGRSPTPAPESRGAAPAPPARAPISQAAPSSARSLSAYDPGPITLPPPIPVEIPPPPAPAGAGAHQRVTDIGLVPEGVLISSEEGEFPLNDADRKKFAVLRTSAATCITLVVDAEWGTPRMFEIRRRLGAELGSAATEVRADASVLTQVYETLHPTTKSGRVHDITKAEQMVWGLIERGVDAEASDIHVEARGGHAEVPFRVNGERQRVSSISMEEAVSFGRVLYTVYAEDSSKEAAWDQAKVQDCVVEHITSRQSRVQLRFSSGPIYPSPNFHIVIRILRMSVTTRKTFEEMGYTERQARLITNMLSGSRGAVVVVGPVNSGKSTTLQSMLAQVFELRGSTIKIITAEDPVEYVVPGAVQISVPRKRASMNEDGINAFATILKGALRQDPDVLMVGEMRDKESATLVKDAVLTGRKLFTTLHGNSAVGAFVRLREIGVEWDVLTSPGFISGIIYQRLLPVLCDKCRIPIRVGAYRLSADTLLRMEQVVNPMKDDVYVRGDGCPQCNNSGYVGRTVCAELLIPDHSFLKLMAGHQVLEAEQYWLQSAERHLDADASTGEPEVDAYPTVLAHAVSKMRRGLIDPRDIELQVDALTHDSMRYAGATSIAGRLRAGRRTRSTTA